MGYCGIEWIIVGGLGYVFSLKWLSLERKGLVRGEREKQEVLG